jgi:catechol 2,3-dioxygenase-like lactoylglutathione lyase family enzyme
MYRNRQVEPDRGEITGTPRIIAVDDVHLTAPPGTSAQITRFYTELIGLELLPGESNEDRLAFRGFPRSGPRLYVSLEQPVPRMSNRRQLLVQVASLLLSAQTLQDDGLALEWSHGWFFYDRRLAVQDPAGNRVELVAYHVL